VDRIKRAVWRSLLSLLLGSGCMMPAPVLRLAPRTQEVVWIGGTAAQIQRGKNTRAAVAFVREQGDAIAFRVELENLSDQPIVVDPAHFYYVTCWQKGVPPSRSCGSSRYVKNPEQALLALDMAHSRDIASAANHEAFLGAMLLLEVGAGVASATTGRGGGTTHALIAADGTADSLRAVEQRRHHQASAYELERSNWSTAALRKNTLLPGNAVAGLVFIDKDPSASEVSLQIRSGDETLPFPFEQTAYQVRFRNRSAGHGAEGLYAR
jgi:hypothetical protein